MLRKSVALGTGFSTVLSLLDLNTFGPITFWLSKNQTSLDQFTLYGTLDAGATDATNAANLGSFSGNTPQDILDGYARQAATWPFLFVKRNSGVTAGTFYVAGNEDAPITVTSNPVPALNGYTAVFDLTGYSAAGVRVGGSALMTTNDIFLVYATEDNTVTSSTGCQLVGRITGGGGTNPTSCIVRGFPYVIVQRIGGNTLGNVLACGVSPPVFNKGDPWVQGGNAFGVPGILGTTDLQPMAIIGSNTVFIQDNTGTSTIGRTGGASTTILQSGSGGLHLTSFAGGNADITPGASGFINLLPRGPGAGDTATLRFRELTVNGTDAVGLKAPDSLAVTLDYTLPSTAPTVDGQMLSSTAAGNLTWTSFPSSGVWTQGGNAFGATGVLGTTDAQPMSVISGGSVFLQDDGALTTIGRLFATDTLVTGGSVGISGLGLEFNTGPNPGDECFRDNGFNVVVGHVKNGATLVLEGPDGWLGRSVNQDCTLSALSNINLNCNLTVRSQGSRVEVPATTIGDGTGSLGTAAATVNAFSLLLVNQTTPVDTYASMRTIADPTLVGTVGRRVTVLNIGTAPFLLGSTDAGQGLQGINMVPGMSSMWFWTGTIWNPVDHRPGVPVIAANLNDGDATLSRIGCYTRYNMPSITLNRILTFNLTGVRYGDQILVSRTSQDATTLTVRDSVGTTLAVLPASKKGGALIGYYGSDWIYLWAASLG